MTTASNALAALIGESDSTGSKERHAAASILLRVVMGNPAKAVLSGHTAVIGPRSAHVVVREIKAIIEHSIGYAGGKPLLSRRTRYPPAPGPAPS